MQHTIFYNSDYNACGHEFETTRKSLDIADTLTGHSLVKIEDPLTAYGITEDLINALHDPAYVNAVKTGIPIGLAQSQGFDWDENIYTMAKAHNAGVVAAVDRVLHTNSRIAGTLSSGLHHSKRGHGEGFCTFNGLAVASQHALNLGLERVLVLDFDAHCGGGTRLMTDPQRVVQIDVSTNTYDFWDPTNDFDWFKVARVEDYLTDIAAALDYATSCGTFDLVLYNAGMDPANSGVTFTDLALREDMVAGWATERGFPLAYTLAGGYLGYNISSADLVSLHRLTIDSFALT